MCVLHRVDLTIVGQCNLWKDIIIPVNSYQFVSKFATTCLAQLRLLCLKGRVSGGRGGKLLVPSRGRDLPVRSTALLGGNPWRRPTPVAEVLFWDKHLTNSETRLKTHGLWMVLSIFGGFVVGNVCSEVVINWGYNKVGEQTLRNIRRISWSSDGFWCPEPQYGVTSNYWEDLRILRWSNWVLLGVMAQ